jgi:hypothetical protein
LPQSECSQQLLPSYLAQAPSAQDCSLGQHFPASTHSPVGQRRSRGQHVPRVAHDLFGQRRPPVQAMPARHLARACFVSRADNLLHRLAMNFFAHCIAMGFPRQLVMQPFEQTAMGLCANERSTAISGVRSEALTFCSKPLCRVSDDSLGLT